MVIRLRRCRNIHKFKRNLGFHRRLSHIERLLVIQPTLFPLTLLIGDIEITAIDTRRAHCHSGAQAHCVHHLPQARPIRVGIFDLNPRQLEICIRICNLTLSYWHWWKVKVAGLVCQLIAILVIVAETPIVLYRPHSISDFAWNYGGRYDSHAWLLTECGLIFYLFIR